MNPHRIAPEGATATTINTDPPEFALTYARIERAVGEAPPVTVMRDRGEWVVSYREQHGAGGTLELAALRLANRLELAALRLANRLESRRDASGADAEAALTRIANAARTYLARYRAEFRVMPRISRPGVFVLVISTPRMLTARMSGEIAEVCRAYVPNGWRVDFQFDNAAPSAAPART